MIGDIFALQDEIANTIVAKLRDTVPTELPATAIVTSAPTTNLDAYEVLLHGRQYLNRRDEASLRRSILLFQEAIELDARYGQAYVELAKAYALLPTYSAEIQDEMFDLALATLAAGVEQDAALDDSMQVVLALVASARWDWIGGGDRIPPRVGARRATIRTYSSGTRSSCRPSVARLRQPSYARRAKELDLLSPVVNHRLSVASMWIDADDDAARYAQIAEELGMGRTPDAYIVLKFRQRDHAAVRPLLIGVQTMFGKPTAWVDPLLAALASPERTAEAVEALARAEEARDVPPKYLFGVVALSRRNRARRRRRPAPRQRSAELQRRVRLLARGACAAPASALRRARARDRLEPLLGPLRLAGDVPQIRRHDQL